MIMAAGRKQEGPDWMDFQSGPALKLSSFSSQPFLLVPRVIKKSPRIDMVYPAIKAYSFELPARGWDITLTTSTPPKAREVPATQ